MGVAIGDCLPPEILKTALGKLLSDKSDLASLLAHIRSIAGQIGAQSARTVPDYTDHSLTHMDALWRVVDSVLSPEEISRFTAGEAFLLGASFYVHDLGMALAATADGLEQVRKSVAYKAIHERALAIEGLSPQQADVLAVQVASREMHAAAALSLATEVIPGLNRFLIESSDARDVWGRLVGEVSASHHWPLAVVDEKLGRKRLQIADQSIDVAYVACVLRIVDFAHINHERARHIDLAFRLGVSRGSLMHWGAQARIVGPTRDQNMLAYASLSPISDVNAWWLFFDMCKALDAEIRGVRDYLNDRVSSKDRFCLEGVQAVEAPETFSRQVELPAGILPVDVRIQPDSMDRLIELLGGKELYGNDILAAVRELLQNARDAIELRRCYEVAKEMVGAPPLIKIAMTREGEREWLVVEDNGIGMTRTVVTKYLIGVAAKFWESAEFFRDFTGVREQGFSPVGKFGIGFLSVFMIGDIVEVVTSRAGGSRLQLILRGIGHRGELKEGSSDGWSGTRIRVRLKQDVSGRFQWLSQIARARAPMLSIPMRVHSVREPDEVVIDEGWWKKCGESELVTFLANWSRMMRGGVEEEKDPDRSNKVLYRYMYDKYESHQIPTWPGIAPSTVADHVRLLSSGGQRSSVLVCSQGFAVGTRVSRDFAGMVDLGLVPLDASRSQILDSGNRDRDDFADENVVRDFRRMIRPAVLQALNELERFGMLPARLALVRKIAGSYGGDILSESTMPWIPVLEPPGNTVYKSAQVFMSNVARADCVVVAVDMGPGRLYKKLCESEVPWSKATVVMIPLEKCEVDHDRKKEVKETFGETVAESLDTIQKIADARDNKIFMPQVLGLIARAWKVSADDLQSQKWNLEVDSGDMWGVLVRPVQV